MSVPISKYYSVQAIPGAGRGVIASCLIEQNVLLLKSSEPAAHVVFRQYRKEVCAQCFFYDRGRTLRVRDNAVGKVFCSDECQNQWQLQQEEVGVVAWNGVEEFTRANAKAIVNAYALEPIGERPSEALIDSTWDFAEKSLRPRNTEQQALNGHTINSQPGSKHPLKNKPRKPNRIDPGLISYFLSGTIAKHGNELAYQDSVAPLARDSQPYKSQSELTVHTEAFKHLHAILPSTLRTVLTAELCRTLIDAGSHNSFGLRSGGEDAEEYMGYALYPSASYFNHSCVPNVSKRRMGRIWEFRTARSIESREELCISYLGGDEKDMNVKDRRSRLADVWGFTCMCKRCIEEAS